MDRQSIKYRPDIDGLRGFLIIIVVTYHFFPKILSGGFSGVDIFFVISGYLISSITLIKICDSKFSITGFYKNRILRLFPALTVLLLTALFIGFFMLTPTEYSQLGLHVFGGAFYISNFQYWQETGYFGEASKLKPFLHLWSLSIEEQFYLLYPLAIYILHRLLSLKNVITVLIFGALCSFGLNIYLSYTHPIANFFFPLSRIWEFLAGSLLAYKEISSDPNHNQKFLASKIVKEILGYVGFCLMLLGAYLINDHSKYPGALTLFPVLGSIAFIYSNNSSKISNLFQSKFLIFFGLISYSLYLWHWMLLVFARLATGTELNLALSTSIIALSILIAYLSYRYIEKPFRFSKNTHAWKLWLSSLCLIGILGLAIFQLNGFPFRIDKLNETYNSRGEFNSSHDNITKCNTPSEVIDSRCFTNSQNPTVAILGDSHAGSLAHGFSVSEDLSFRNFIAIYAGNCHPTIGLDSRCTKQSTYSIERLKDFQKLDLIVITGYSNIIENDQTISVDNYVAGYNALLSQLIPFAKKIVYVVDPPHLPESPSNCSKFNLPFRDLLNIEKSICKNALLNTANPHNRYSQFLAKLKSQNPNLIIYDPINIFVTNGYINIKSDNMLLYSDTHHISDYGSKLLVDELLKHLSDNH